MSVPKNAISYEHELVHSGSMYHVSGGNSLATFVVIGYDH